LISASFQENDSIERPVSPPEGTESMFLKYIYIHWGKADDRNCNYGHPKMADMKLGKNLFCQLNCFYNA
jgi:hypothetical protein